MFRKYRLVPSAAPSTPQLQQPSGNNNIHTVTDPPENPILTPTAVSGKIVSLEQAKKVPEGISKIYENEMLQNYSNVEKERAKLLIDFLRKVVLQTNENGEILYANVVGSPLSQMVAFLVEDASYSPTKQKRPWDLRRFLELLEEKQVQLGINVPWQFLGNGKRQVVNKVVSPPTYLQILNGPKPIQSKLQKTPRTAKLKMTMKGGTAARNKSLKKSSPFTNWKRLF